MTLSQPSTPVHYLTRGANLNVERDHLLASLSRSQLDPSVLSSSDHRERRVTTQYPPERQRPSKTKAKASKIFRASAPPASAFHQHKATEVRSGGGTARGSRSSRVVGSDGRDGGREINRPRHDRGVTSNGTHRDSRATTEGAEQVYLTPVDGGIQKTSSRNRRSSCFKERPTSRGPAGQTRHANTNYGGRGRQSQSQLKSEDEDDTDDDEDVDEHDENAERLGTGTSDHEDSALDRRRSGRSRASVAVAERDPPPTSTMKRDSGRDRLGGEGQYSAVRKRSTVSSSRKTNSTREPVSQGNRYRNEDEEPPSPTTSRSPPQTSSSSTSCSPSPPPAPRSMTRKSISKTRNSSRSSNSNSKLNHKRENENGNKKKKLTSKEFFEQTVKHTVSAINQALMASSAAGGTNPARSLPATPCEPEPERGVPGSNRELFQPPASRVLAASYVGAPAAERGSGPDFAPPTASLAGARPPPGARPSSFVPAARPLPSPQLSPVDENEIFLGELEAHTQTQGQENEVEVLFDRYGRPVTGVLRNSSASPGGGGAGRLWSSGVFSPPARRRTSGPATTGAVPVTGGFTSTAASGRAAGSAAFLQETSLPTRLGSQYGSGWTKQYGAAKQYEDESFLTSMIGNHRVKGIYGDDVDWCKPYYIVEDDEEDHSHLAEDDEVDAYDSELDGAERYRDDRGWGPPVKPVSYRSRASASGSGSGAGRSGRRPTGYSPGAPGSTTGSSERKIFESRPRTNTRPYERGKVVRLETARNSNPHSHRNSGEQPPRQVSFAERHHSILPDEDEMEIEHKFLMSSQSRQQELKAASPAPSGALPVHLPPQQLSAASAATSVADFRSPASSYGDEMTKHEPSIIDGVVDLFFGDDQTKKNKVKQSTSTSSGKKTKRSRVKSKSRSASRRSSTTSSSRSRRPAHHHSHHARSGSRSGSRRRKAKSSKEKDESRERHRGGERRHKRDGRRRGRHESCERTSSSEDEFSTASTTSSRSASTSRSRSRSRDRDKIKKKSNARNSAQRSSTRSARSTREISVSSQSRTSDEEDEEIKDGAAGSAEGTTRSRTSAPGSTTASGSGASAGAGAGAGGGILKRSTT